MQKDQLRRLIIPAGLTIGDNTIVTGGQLGAGVGSIRVWQIELESSGAQTITPKSNATIIPGQIVHTGAGSTTTLQGTGIPWMETLPGQSLVWNLTAAGPTTVGAIWFSLA